MTWPLKLPARLDLAQALPLVSTMREMDGDVEVDASEVRHLGALCLQALIAAARKATADGHRFVMIGATDKVLEQMKVMGTSPETLMEGPI
jgi:chemotaxis protein CheX